MRIDLDLLRNALLITLSILVLVLLFRRFRQRVLLRDMPAPRHAELLDQQGNLYTENLRTAAQTVRYTLKGSTEADQFGIDSGTA